MFVWFTIYDHTCPDFDVLEKNYLKFIKKHTKTDIIPSNIRVWLGGKRFS